MEGNEEKYKAFEIKVEGRVQGVGFRYSAIRTARSLNLTGWVRNEYDGSVSLFCEGPQDAVNRFIQWCRKGPPGSHVVHMDIIPRTYQKRYSNFGIA